MARLYPEMIFKEQVQILDLIGTINEVIDTLKDEESYTKKDQIEFLKDKEIAEQNSMVELRIPLLVLPFIREGMSLSDYIIYLIILATNLQGKYFDEENKYINFLTGIKPTQIDKSIRYLTKNFFVFYVDKHNQLCPNYKPLTEKQLIKYYQKYPERQNDVYGKQVNNQRILVVNPEIFEYLKKEKPLITKAARKEARQEAKAEKKMQDIINRRIEKLIPHLIYGHKLSSELILRSKDENFPNEYPSEYQIITDACNREGVNINDIIQYCDNIR